MKADVKTLYDLTSSDVRYLVPRYQRPYVWTEEKHWEPLWSDVEAAFDRLERGEDRDHFLGAIVLKEGGTPPGEPTRYEVIDGQQRLTTTQILFAAAANVSFEAGVERVGRRLSKMVLNDPDAADGDKRFKFWPTARDRDAFRLVASPGGPSPEAEDDPNNTIQEAYDFFRRQVSEFVVGDGSDAEATSQRLETLRSVLASVFKIVAIRLDSNDEAQVIFETLNARGTPLLALDLVKNAVFQAADLNEDEMAVLHDEVWEPEFGLAYWREETRQGRLTRPRAEIFLFHWMTMKLGLRGGISNPIRSDRVFQTFSSEFLKDRSGPGPVDLVQELTQAARTMRELEQIGADTPEARFLRTTEFLDTSVFYPIVLHLFVDPEVSVEDRRETLAVLESFQVRRALLRWTTKSYSRIALGLLRSIGESSNHPGQTLRNHFENATATMDRWPTDVEVREWLEERPIYGWVSRGKLAGILSEIERDLRSDGKTEQILLANALSIEHVMPQTWEKTWPLEEASPEATEVRNELVQTLGNLTLVTGQLNSTLSNQSWPSKRERFRKHSLLLLNSRIAEEEAWTDESIRARGAELVERIIALWPGPAGTPVSPDQADRFPSGDTRSGGDFTELELARVLESSSERFRSLMLDLTKHQGRWRMFSEVEVGLGWSPGSLPAVLAGFTRANPDLEGRRPFDTRVDPNSKWSIRINPALMGVYPDHATGSSAKQNLNESEQRRLDFFTGLLEVATERTSLHSGVSPTKDDSVSCGAGTSWLHWVYRIRPGQTRVMLAMEGPDAGLNQQRFDSIFAHKDEIERDFGGTLEWDAVDGRKRCLVQKTSQLGGYDAPREEWPEIFEMTTASMAHLEQALRIHVSRIVHEAL